MAKKQIRVSIEEELIKEAKCLGINLRKTCELAIRNRVAALKALDGIEDLEGG